MAKGYIVTAPLIVVRDTGGRDHYLDRGHQVRVDVDPERLAALLRKGLIQELEQADAPDVAASDIVEFDSPPPKNAKAEVWHAYALYRGFTADELTDLKKPDLVELATNGAPAALAGQPADPAAPATDLVGVNAGVTGTASTDE